jgi:hypothetical protein
MTDIAVINNTATLQDIRDDVYFLVGEDSATFPVVRVNKVVNDALGKVWNETHKEYDTIYTTVETDEFATEIPDAKLVNGTAVVYEVLLSGGTDLLEKAALAANPFSVQLDTYEIGAPTSYAIERNVLYLYPTPDQPYVISMRYRGEFTPLVEETDTAPMSDAEISAAKYFSAYILKTADEEFEAAGAFKNLYDDAIGGLLIQETGMFPAEQYSYYGGAY